MRHVVGWHFGLCRAPLFPFFSHHPQGTVRFSHVAKKYHCPFLILAAELSGLSAGKTWVKVPSTRWGSWCRSRSGCWRVRWAAEAGTADQGWGGAPSSRGLGAEAQAGRRENRPVTETQRSSLPVRVLGETAGNRQTGKAAVLSQGCGVSWWVVPVDSAVPLLLSLKAKDVSQGSYPPVPASAGSPFSPQPPVSPHPLVQVPDSYPGWEDLLEKEMATHWGTLAWKIHPGSQASSRRE